MGKHFRTELNEILREGWQWGSEQMVKFGGDPDHRLDTGIVFRVRRVRHCWDIRKVVNGLFIHTDSPDGGRGYYQAGADLEPICQMAGVISRHW